MCTCSENNRFISFACICIRLVTNLILRFFFILTECLRGDVGTLLLSNPVGQNSLKPTALITETAKVFGLRGRKIKLYMDEELNEGTGSFLCTP